MEARLHDTEITIKIDSDNGFSVRVRDNGDLEKLGADRSAWDAMVNEAMFQIKSKKPA